MQVLLPIYGLADAGDEAARLERAGVDGVFTFEGPHDVFLPLALAAAATELSIMTNVAIAFPRNAVEVRRRDPRAPVRARVRMAPVVGDAKENVRPLPSPLLPRGRLRADEQGADRDGTS